VKRRTRWSEGHKGMMTRRKEDKVRTKWNVDKEDGEQGRIKTRRNYDKEE